MVRKFFLGSDLMTSHRGEEREEGIGAGMTLDVTAKTEFNDLHDHRPRLVRSKRVQV